MTTTLSTAVLDRLTAEEGTKYTLSVTPVTANTLAGAAIDAEIGWFVTEVDHGSVLATAEQQESFPRTIRKVKYDGNGYRPRYQTGVDETAYLRVTGAPVNPAPVDGHHYAVLENNGGPEVYVVRYNDEDHVSLRHRPGLPFSIVSGRGGAPWPLANDSLADQSISDMVYIEVEAPVTAGSPAVSEAAGVVLREHIDGDPAGPTFGLAEANADGHVEVNPAPVEGKFYIHWEEGAPTVTLAQRVGEAWKSLGYYQRVTSNGEPTGDLRWSGSVGIHIGEGTRWALARLETPAPAPEDFDLIEHRNTVVRLLAQESAKWERLDEALTTLAKDKNWCSEFESFAEPLGFSPRETKGDWVVVVTARVSGSIDSPDSSLDSRTESIYDLPGLEMTSMTFEGSMQVRIHVSDETEDGARDYVDSSVVEENIDSSAEITVHDYEIDRIEAD